MATNDTQNSYSPIITDKKVSSSSTLSSSSSPLSLPSPSSSSSSLSEENTVRDSYVARLKRKAPESFVEQQQFNKRQNSESSDRRA